MNDLYRIPGPSSPPPVPDRWSFSSLQEWRNCPRRWWLVRAGYPGITGRYPQLVHAATIAGRLVHDALEAFARQAARAFADGATYDKARRSFPVRMFMKRRLREIIDAEIEPNPRLDASGALAKLALDECVNAFRSAAGAVLGSSIPTGAGWTSHGPLASPRGGPPDGAERIVTIEDPPLTGRLDLTRAGVVYDFKTGEPAQDHLEQLRVYALLIWQAFGTPPAGLELYYVRTGTRMLVPVPSENELSELRANLRLEIEAANEAVRSGAVAVKPSVDGCRWCPVRQYCDDYWDSSETDALRWPGCSRRIDAEGTQVHFADLELTDFPSQTGSEGYYGVAYTPTGESVSLALPAAMSPGPGARPEKLRLLGARIERTTDRVAVSASKQTEVFWLAWRAHTR